MSNTLDEILEVIIPKANEVDGMTEEIHNMAKLTAKQQIQALITDKLVDKLYELMDEAEDGHPDGCNSVHTHNIEAHIAELIKEKN